MNNSWIPETSLEWFDWLSAEENKTRKSYLAKPANLISDYRGELTTTRDYKGREILELLQNAADQARKASVTGKVIIDLQPEGLIVGNTGAAFSIGGVLSLETTNLSPKRHKQQRFIGNKGLGFRSVLNWTNAPMIFSDTLSLVYSENVSLEKLKELQNENSELASLTTQECEGKDILPIPVLPFPGYNRDGDINSFVQNTEAQHLQKRCRQLQEEGYTTTIGMPFEKASFFDDAYEQINTLQPEILLFVEHLDEIRFLVHEKEERIWSKEKNGRQYMVMDNEDPLEIWQVHQTQGIVPEEMLQTDQESPLHYELIVAVPEVESMEDLKVAPLFSHFPTTISLPLPVVCHATLELNQSRNHTQNRDSNSYVLKQLTTFLAQIAEERAALYPTGPKAGFRMLMAQETYPSDLEREKFSENLLEAAAQRKIIPTIDGSTVRPEQAQILSGAQNSWLPKSAFGTVAPVENRDEQNFFHDLGVKELDTELLRKKLLTLQDISIKERTNLIAGLLENKIASDAHTSALLLNSHGQNIPDGAAVFTAPLGGTTPNLPKWVTLRFLNNELRLGLAKKLETKDNRDLQGKLSSFGLREYSFAGLISRLIAAANKQKKQQPDLATNIDRQLLSTVFSLYCAEGKSGSRPTFPEKTSFPLPTQNGSTASAEDLYMGRGYGITGNITQGLYGSWSPERLIEKPETLGLSVPEDVELSDFFKWLGVATWPRRANLLRSNDEYLNHVLDSIHYPATFQEYTFHSRSSVSRPDITNIKSIDGLEEILSRGDSIAVVAWLALDARTPTWTSRSRACAHLIAIRGRDFNPRRYNESIPSYIKWKIETTEWLLDKDRELLRPKDCVLGQRAIETLFPKPARPDKKTLKLYGLNNNDLIDGWRRSGVLTSLAELELDDIYVKLLDLPERQPGGQSARSLYTWLLDAADSTPGEADNAQKRFFKEGQMWGYKGDVRGYFPVSELHHADTEVLPSGLLDQLKVVDLPFRVGAKKVKHLFGVESVDRNAFKQKLKQFDPAENLDAEFQDAKPFFSCLRASRSSQKQYVERLNQLTLKICSKLHTEMEYNEKKIDYELPIWGWLIDNDVLYIRSDPMENTDGSSDLLADAIGEAIASVFRIGSGGAFARIFLCRHKDRKALLKRMLGEDSHVDIDAIIKESNQIITEEPFEMLSDIGPIEEPQPSEEGETSIETAQSEQKQSDTDATENAPLTIEELDHHPAAPQIKQEIRIQKTSGEHSGAIPAHRVTNADFAERKIMEFEQSFQPPRYPLRVGQLTGTEAPGCDILSFSSEQDRDDFKSGANRNKDKVKRFIEVKGRKHQGTKIELRGNEKDAANTYRNRYYLYRLFVSEDNEHILSILQNPLASGEVETSVYIDLDRAEKTEVLKLSDGIET